jgi:CTP:molybdopterin cytidylyltransferase MocA
MGVPKALLRWEGAPLARVHAEVLGARARRVVVVLGAEAPLLRAQLPGLFTAENVDWEQSGMLGSLRVGLRALGDVAPVLVSPVDVPPVSPEVLDALLAAGAPAVPLDSAGNPGHPVLLDRATVARVLADPPPTSLREALADAKRVATGDPHVAVDFDVPSAWALARPNQRKGPS